MLPVETEFRVREMELRSLILRAFPRGLSTLVRAGCWGHLRPIPAPWKLRVWQSHHVYKKAVTAQRDGCNSVNQGSDDLSGRQRFLKEVTSSWALKAE